MPMKPSSHEKLIKTLVRKREHGIRKNYYGRAPADRYDSKDKIPTLTEIHPKPMKLWLDTLNQPKDDEFHFIIKLSSDYGRRNVSELTNQTFSFIDAGKQKSYLVTIVRFYRSQMKSGNPCKVVCIVRDAQTREQVRETFPEPIASLSQKHK